MKLFLIGYMGCGKSTLARKLARATAWRAADTDAETERAEGAAVAEIFGYEGEEYFRRAERASLERLTEDPDVRIVATGGGLPVWADNMEYMNRCGVTVYLRRSARGIASRLTPYGRKKRPRLRGLSDEELVAFMERDIAAREPFYLRSREVIECDALGDGAIVERLMNLIRNA